MEINKRSFLKLSGAGILATIASILETGCKEKPVLPSPPVPPAVLPMGLKLVKQEYLRLYNYIKAEKEKADKEGKDLVIVAGELHNASNSTLLLNFMLLSITSRLGIKEFIVELDEAPILESIRERAEEIKQVKIKGDFGNELETEETYDIAILSELKKCERFPENFSYDFEATDVFHYTWFYAAILGFDFVASDLLHGMDKRQVGTYEPREEKMVSAINGIKGSKVSTNGVIHLSSLVEKLKLTNSNHVVGLNFDCGQNSYSLGKDENPKAKEFLEARTRTAREFYSPKIPASPQLQAEQAFALAVLASNQHMVETGEMTYELSAKVEARILDKLPDLPGLQSGLVR